jgi:hypothetical protein
MSTFILLDADTSVMDAQNFVLLVGDDVDIGLLLSLKDGSVRDNIFCQEHLNSSR